MADNSCIKGLELAINDIIANLKIMDEYASSDSDYMQAHKMSCFLQRVRSAGINAVGHALSGIAIFG
jgi:hypothetical protein